MPDTTTQEGIQSQQQAPELIAPQPISGTNLPPSEMPPLPNNPLNFGVNGSEVPAAPNYQPVNQQPDNTAYVAAGTEPVPPVIPPAQSEVPAYITGSPAPIPVVSSQPAAYTEMAQNLGPQVAPTAPTQPATFAPEAPLQTTYAAPEPTPMVVPPAPGEVTSYITAPPAPSAPAESMNQVLGTIGTVGQGDVSPVPPTQTFAQMAPNIGSGEDPGKPELKPMKLDALKGPIKDYLSKFGNTEEVMRAANEEITTGGPGGGRLDPEFADVWYAAFEEELKERRDSNSH